MVKLGSQVESVLPTFKALIQPKLQIFGDSRSLNLAVKGTTETMMLFIDYLLIVTPLRPDCKPTQLKVKHKFLPNRISNKNSDKTGAVCSVLFHYNSLGIGNVNGKREVKAC